MGGKQRMNCEVFLLAWSGCRSLILGMAVEQPPIPGKTNGQVIQSEHAQERVENAPLLRPRGNLMAARSCVHAVVPRGQRCRTTAKELFRVSKAVQ
jgi:hypothetical protein